MDTRRPGLFARFFGLLRGGFAGWLRPATPATSGSTAPGVGEDLDDDAAGAPDDELDLDGIRDAARRPLTPISDDETLVIPRIRVGSGR